MGFTPAQKLQTGPKANASGISMSMSKAPKSGTVSVRLTFSEAGQESLFGRKLDRNKDRLDVLIGRAQDQGIMRLRLDPEGEFELAGSVRGAVTVRIAAWDLLPRDEGKRPAGECKKLGDTENENEAKCVNILLPDWANPAKREEAAKRAHMSAKGGR